jgi:hypothetical protein
MAQPKSLAWPFQSRETARAALCQYFRMPLLHQDS